MTVFLSPSPPRSAPPPHPSSFSLFLSRYNTNRQVKKKNKSKRSEKAEQRKHTIRNHSTQEKYQWDKITFTKQNKTKNLQKYHWVPFCVGHLLWAWDQPWCMKKKKQSVFFHWWKLFFFLFKQFFFLLVIASWLRMGYCFSSGCLYDLDMCIKRLCLGRDCFQGAIHPLWLLQSIHLLFCMVPKL